MRLHDRLREALLGDAGSSSSPGSTEPRLADGDETPVNRRETRASSFSSAASFNLFHKEGASMLDDHIDVAERSDEESDVAQELKAAKSLLEMYKQRSGDLCIVNEDLRNQLMSLQIENNQLKIANEELKSRNEALVQASQAQTESGDGSGQAGRAE